MTVDEIDLEVEVGKRERAASKFVDSYLADPLRWLESHQSLPGIAGAIQRRLRAMPTRKLFPMAHHSDENGCASGRQVSTPAAVVTAEKSP